MDLKKLAVKHDYYASDSNYYSNDAHGRYATFADFYEDFGSIDPDLNLIFRWDVAKREESGRYCAEVFYVLQRKGIYLPVRIDYIDEIDVKLFVDLMKKHWAKLQSIWQPISDLPPDLKPNPGTDSAE